MQLSSAFLAIALLAEYASAQLGQSMRFACSQLTVDRIDPLVNPKQTFTGHLHQIIGGNSFKPDMNASTHDLPSKSTCTSCSFNQDFSNYWTAPMFFRHRNGSYIRVPQIANTGLQQTGGMDVYYIPHTTAKVKAFAPGFRMLVGDAANTDVSKVDVRSICNRCWTAASETTFVGSTIPCQGDQVEIPTGQNCNFIRQSFVFPTCWDGVNLDTADHKSHMAYSDNRQANGGGNCPSSHPQRVPQIMYEIMWDTRNFVKNTAWWPTDGGPPYVYAMGIGGAGAHGDYVFGWKGDSLQKAIDNKCAFNGACPAAGLTVQSKAQFDACKVPQASPEQVDGWLPNLPGRGAGSSTVVGPTTPAPSTTTTRSATSTSSGGTVPKYGQCGGQGYTGPTQCAAGTTCTFSNQYYSQCL